MRASVVGALGGLLVLGTVLRFILRRQLRVGYAALWLVVSTAIAVIALIPGLLEATSTLAGFEVPANFLFFTGVVLLLWVGIHLSVAVSRLEDHVQRLAEELAIMAEGIERAAPGERVQCRDHVDLVDPVPHVENARDEG
jgi:hypothetical protein